MPKCLLLYLLESTELSPSLQVHTKPVALCEAEWVHTKPVALCEVEWVHTKPVALCGCTLNL